MTFPSKLTKCLFCGVAFLLANNCPLGNIFLLMKCLTTAKRMTWPPKSNWSWARLFLAKLYLRLQLVSRHLNKQQPLLSLIFGLFKQKLQFLQQYMWKMSIQYRDSNPRPLGNESPPITTRPGFPPKYYIMLCEECHL